MYVSVNTVMPDADICVDPKMKPPNNLQAKFLRQIVLSGMGDHVARYVLYGLGYDFSVDPC